MNQALKFESVNLHLEKFVVSLGDEKDKDTIITGGSDLMIKVFSLSSNFEVTSIDVNEEVGAIGCGCGKIVYGQGNTLQLVNLPNPEAFDYKFNPNSSILLTNFNSTVRKIVFNEKLNLVIAFSEDDDLHVININNLDVFKYKSNHDGSLKNMAVSFRGDFLITTGCDGFLNVYEFHQEDVGKIISKKKLKIGTKLGIESSQNFEVSTNSMGLCAISGNILLRTLQLDTFIPAENLNIIYENTISHKSDISMVKWLKEMSSALVTGDLSGLFKIWNFSYKTCIYQLQCNAVNNGNFLIQENVNKNYFNLIINDVSGNLNISEEILYTSINGENTNSNSNINKYKENIKKHLIKNETEVDKAVDDILEAFEKESDNEEREKEQTEEILNLSDIEDENGEIKDKEEIEKAKEEKKLANAGPRLESIADEIIQSLPQPGFFSSATNISNLNSSRYLCWNLIGQIVSRQETAFKAIDITFADISNKKKITYIDTNDLCYAVLNNCGAFLANKLEEENEDEYEKEDSRKNAVIVFKSIHNNSYSMLKDWTLALPTKENPLSLAVGVDWCAVYTSMMYLRLFSLHGNEKIVLSIPHIVTMAGFENYLACVYHSSAPLFGSQSLRFKILNSDDFFNEIYDGILPLSPNATLIWFNFSEDGILLTYDSSKILRGFILGVCNNWLPLLDVERLYETTYNSLSGGLNYWIIGMREEEVYGVELKNYLPEPQVGGKYIVKVHKTQIPFISSTDNKTDSNDLFNKEESLLKNSLFLKHDIKRFQNFNFLRQLRNVRAPDFYYTDNLKDESDIHKKKVEHDKLALSLMNDFISADNPEKVVSLFESLMLSKSREMALQICNYHEIRSLEQLLKDKEKIINLKENQRQEKNRNNYNVSDDEETEQEENRYLKSDQKNTSNKKLQSSSKNNNPLASLAINLNNMRDLEEEVRNELGLEFDANEEGKNDLSNLEVKQSSLGGHGLEKKNVIYY